MPSIGIGEVRVPQTASDQASSARAGQSARLKLPAQDRHEPLDLLDRRIQRYRSDADQVWRPVVGDDAEALLSRLAGRGVIADYRAPDLIRVAPMPLYTTVEEVERFVAILRGELESG